MRIIDVKVVYGAPLSGKSTYVNENKDNNDLIFDFDLLMRDVSGLKIYERNENLISYLVDFRNLIIEKLEEESKIDIAWIIISNPKGEIKEKLEKLNAEFILMDVDKETCKKRLEKDKDRDKKVWNSLIDEWFSEKREVKKMNNRHSYFASKFKTRSEGEDEKYIEGYFAVFDCETEIFDGWFEKIQKKAFDNSIKNNDIRCLFNHDSGFVLGRTSNKTLELKSDDKGLWGKVKINTADSGAMDVYSRVQRGDISGCSFGFCPVKESYKDRDNGVLCTVEEADTMEVSICTFPAYEKTQIQARQKDYNRTKEKTIEQKRQELKTKLEGIKC